MKAMLGSVRLTTPVVTLGEHVKQVSLMYNGGKTVTGMVVVGECMCVTHSKDPHLWLYDMTSGRCKNRSTVTGLKDPQGMGLVRSGLKDQQGLGPVKSADHTIVITDVNNDGGKLHYVKVSTDFSVTYVKECTLPVKHPRKISVSRQTGEMFIGQLGIPQFVVCNLEGEVLKQVTVTSPDGTERFPRCVTRSKDGYAAIVRDKANNSIIQWMDKDGKCTHTYGGEQLKRALHMAIDREGRLIVAEFSNYRISLVDSRGHLLQFLLTQDDSIHEPDCVYLDEEAARLHVSHGRTGYQEVGVYRWQPSDTQTTNMQLEVNISHF